MDAERIFYLLQIAAATERAPAFRAIHDTTHAELLEHEYKAMCEWREREQKR